ncbi:MAG: hypothetical protein K5905_19060 [Roseibium sp.]|uniref:hypothetical protein n=1 Tax=Roseibium sp. TaxID=1936156 RepID=UPI0026265E6D|nr:hypothetical protein [Roseibium sp.]MCV0427564.1 hypothetical protein [Roseibium sp.]
MRLASDIQKADAKQIQPPAAHRTDKFLTEAGPQLDDMDDIRRKLEDCLENRPHDKTEILRLFDNFTKKAMNVHGQSVAAKLDIKAGR